MEKINSKKAKPTLKENPTTKINPNAKESPTTLIVECDGVCIKGGFLIGQTGDVPVLYYNQDITERKGYIGLDLFQGKTDVYATLLMYNQLIATLDLERGTFYPQHGGTPICSIVIVLSFYIFVMKATVKKQCTMGNKAEIHTK